MKFPLVQELAAEGFPVRLTCGVLGFSTQAFYKWQADPVSERDYDDAHLVNVIRDVHDDDPEFGYRFISDELERARPQGGRAPGLAALLGAPDLVDDDEEGPEVLGQATGTGRPRRPRASGTSPPRARHGLADGHHRAPDRSRASSTPAASRTSARTGSSVTRPRTG